MLVKRFADAKPYDAPNWLAKDRPVKFGELAQKEMLSVSGYAPDLIRVNFPTGAGAVNNLEVLDITGQLVLSARPTGQSAVLNVADLRSGVYFVRLITAGAVYPASRFEVLPH